MTITINGSGPVSGLTTLSMGGALTGVTDLTMSGGLATPSVLTVGQGIKFPATQSASSDANTLDDYEEGTFTPTFTGTGSNPTVTYAENSGCYVKVGQLVFFSIHLSTATASGGSGYLNISGLPFTSYGATQAGYQSISVGYQANWQLSQTPMHALVFASATYVRPYYITAVGANKSDIQVGALGNSLDCYFAGCYRTT